MSASIWGNLRSEFPIKNRYAFFNHAAVAPLPARAADAIQQTVSRQRDRGTLDYPAWERQLAEARRNVAGLLGAEPTEVAFVKNTTSGLIIAAEGIPWREGDNVVTSAIEFPANIYPWLNLARRGVATRMVQPVNGRVRIDDLADAMDERTRAVSMSWVQYSNGYRLDLAALSEAVHARGAYLVVDGIQGVGAIPLDVHALGIDFLSADGHKWMLSVEGCGALYVSPEAMGRMDPVNIGWMSVEGASDYSNYDMVLRDDARRFEEGSHNMIGGHALGASSGLILEAGINAVWERIRGVTDRLLEGLDRLNCEVLSPRHEYERSGIVSFRVPDTDPVAVVRRLEEAGILASARNGAVRVSPHFYNDTDEIDGLVAELSRL